MNTLHPTPYMALSIALIAAAVLSFIAKEFKSRNGALSRPWPVEAGQNLLSGRRTYSVLNRIGQLSLDFLILNPDTSLFAAIELDDVTHELGDRPRADANKSHALNSAGIPLIRWTARNLPDTPAIRAALLTSQSADRMPR